ncbi:hypothetical protein BGZ83_005264 [Gryganskiella cystojenkinii]|nr:hypothetical protein BGZ83_005264 [Gryganskiella cystojenkinii]
MVVGESNENLNETVMISNNSNNNNEGGTALKQKQQSPSRIHISNLLCASNNAVHSPHSSPSASPTVTNTPWEARDRLPDQDNDRPGQGDNHEHDTQLARQDHIAATSATRTQRHIQQPHYEQPSEKSWRHTSGAPTPSPSARSGLSFGSPTTATTTNGYPHIGSSNNNNNYREIAPSQRHHERQYSHPARELGPLDPSTSPSHTPQLQALKEFDGSRHPMDLGHRRPSDFGGSGDRTGSSGWNKDKPASSPPWAGSSQPHQQQQQHRVYSVSHFSVAGTNSRSVPSPGQRSASVSSYPYHPIGSHHSSHEQDHQQEGSHRTERSKSDYALHQQNYGPYLDASPLMGPAPLLESARPPMMPHHGHPQDYHGPHSPPLSARSPPSLYYERDRGPPPAESSSSSPSRITEGPLYQSQTATRGSFQGEHRRPSHGHVLPPLPTHPAESSYMDQPPKRRIYGLDAADVPLPPPLAPSAAFGSRPLQNIPDDEHEPPEYSRRPSTATSGPPTGSYPPSWYQHYAHAVPWKPQQPRSSFSHGDGAPTSRRGSEYGAPPSLPMIRQGEAMGSPSELKRSYSVFVNSSGAAAPTRRASSSGIPAKSSTNYSVHPFDNTSSTASSSNDASPKRTSTSLVKRERNQDEESLVPGEDGVKAKRKRANPEQLSVLNAAFERSYFPSTEERIRLSKLTNMCPRTVQIWFQNKRQSVKARTEAMDVAVANHNRPRRGSMAQERARGEELQLIQQQLSQQQQQPQHGPVPLTLLERHHPRTSSGGSSNDGHEADGDSSSSSHYVERAELSDPSPRLPPSLNHYQHQRQPPPLHQQYSHQQQQQPQYEHHDYHHADHPHHPHSSYPHHRHSQHPHAYMPQHQQWQYQPRSTPQSPLARQSSSSFQDSISPRQPHPHQFHQGQKRRSSGPLTPSDAPSGPSGNPLPIQRDDGPADYFSRKRRATIAQMEQH